ncbi:MAG: acyl carrier protein [Anaerohalosphaeraceae bacterium]|nr:acyl carrier protein [Anaerohalosphaeraceae bacterium]
MSIMEDINEVFRDVFDDTNLEVTEQMTAQDISEWDSMAQINLIVAFEEKYDIKFTTEEISVLTCVGDMAKLLEAKRIQ